MSGGWETISDSILIFDSTSVAALRVHVPWYCKFHVGSETGMAQRDNHSLIMMIIVTFCRANVFLK